MFLKALGKVGRVIKPNHERNFSDTSNLVVEQFSRSLEAHNTDEVARRLIRKRLKFAVQLGPAHTGLAAECLYAKVRITHVRFHDLHHML